MNKEEHFYLLTTEYQVSQSQQQQQQQQRPNSQMEDCLLAY